MVLYQFRKVRSFAQSPTTSRCWIQPVLRLSAPEVSTQSLLWTTAAQKGGEVGEEKLLRLILSASARAWTSARKLLQHPLKGDNSLSREWERRAGSGVEMLRKGSFGICSLAE